MPSFSHHAAPLSNAKPAVTTSWPGGSVMALGDVMGDVIGDTAEIAAATRRQRAAGARVRFARGARSRFAAAMRRLSRAG